VSDQFDEAAPEAVDPDEFVTVEDELDAEPIDADAPDAEAGLETVEVADAVERPAAFDEGSVDTDEAIDAIEDGSALTGGVPVRDDVPGSDVLFTLSSREQFAALDDPAATGDARIDAATSRLAELPDLPTPDHVGIYDDVHRRLQDALADAEVT